MVLQTKADKFCCSAEKLMCELDKEIFLLSGRKYDSVRLGVNLSFDKQRFFRLKMYRDIIKRKLLGRGTDRTWQELFNNAKQVINSR